MNDLEVTERLKLEINELNVLRNEAEKQYNAMIRLFDYSFDNIQNMKVELEKRRTDFDDAKVKRICRFSCPCGIITAIMFSIMLATNGDLFNLASLSMMYIGILFTGTLIVILPPVFLAKIDKLNLSFIKKDPKVKRIYDKVCDLEIAIRISEKNLMRIKEKRDGAKSLFRYRDEQLNRKKEELHDYDSKMMTMKSENEINTQEKRLIKRPRYLEN